MNEAPVKLVTKRDSDADRVVAKLQEATDVAEKNSCSGFALVLVKKDGTTWVCTLGNGLRVLLLGAVTDLQHSLAKDGDTE